ncbi:MAG: pH-response regulator protein palA/rim20 [Cirrosporium novae-zelandiae]|nr:MAG: pH-response regulator protein palA/rim20 [Cirrosporium novae-zelandiae]
MASSILQLPFRRTHSVSLSSAIKQYISTKYEQHPDMFTQNLEAIDRLRVDAVNSVEPHISGITKLETYAAQLQWIGGKFPIDIGVDFTWYPALGFNTSKPISQNNLRFELANILYNLAALYSQLAVALNRTTSDGLKSACNYFCLSAGIVLYLKDTVIPDSRGDPPEDMDEMTLSCIEQLLLAQAQECFWQKAIKDGLRDASICRLAVKVSDYYADAGDFGIKSNIISTEWIHHMSAKHHHFAAAAQYRAALDCLDKRKYGEEVARLQDSLNCVNEALKEGRWINRMVLGDMNGLKRRVTEDLKRAEKDNDMIYLDPVPPKSELKTLDRANMVISKTPKEVSDGVSMLGEHKIFGVPLFAKLVPYSVHVAASIYVERKDRLINHTIIDELEAMTTRLRELLQSLNLPGALQALEKPLGVPPSITSKAEELRQQDALNRISRSIEDANKLKSNDKATFSEGLELLQVEKTEDDRARSRFGTERWARLPSKEAAPKLYNQATEIEGYLNSAGNSDELVMGKLKDSEGLLRVLTGTNRDLEEFIPSSRRLTMTPRVENEAGRLRATLNEVSRLESRRKRKIEALKEKARADDINPSLLTEAARLEREFPMQSIEAAQFEGLFETRLQRYDPDRNMLSTEQAEQDKLVSRIRETNTAFTSARRGDSSATREREQALQKLEGAYFKYKEIMSNIEVGRRFYNDLANIVGRFRDNCKTFVYERRSEASQFEIDLANSMSALNLNNLNTINRDNLRHVQQPEDARPLPGSTAPVREPITAPMPTRAPIQIPTPAAGGMWTPDMGIKFGASPAQTEGSPAPSVVSVPPPGQVKGRAWDPSRGLRFS